MNRKKRKSGIPNFGPENAELKKARSIYQRHTFAKVLFTAAKQKRPEDPDFTAARALLAKEEDRRFNLLFEHYNIDTLTDDKVTKLVILARILCTEIAKDFDVYRIKKGRGRPRSTLDTYKLLAEEIARLRAEKTRTVIAVCRILSKDPRWKDMTSKQIQAAYYRMKSLAKGKRK